MSVEVEICTICAWRADCRKKFSISGRDMRCAEFSKDVTLENSPPLADNEDNKTTNKYVGDKIGYYNDALVRWGGLFVQLKYQQGNLTTFLNTTFSYSGYKRIDYFLPQIDGQTNETPWKYIPGFTVKGGANYNLNESMNVFMNLGFISKAQRFSNVYDRQNRYKGPNIYSSKIDHAAYLMDMQGIMHIFKAERTFELVAESPIGENCMTTPAFSDGMIYIRGNEHLFCIGK